MLNHPEFRYIPAKPKSIEEEKAFLRGAKERMKNRTEYTFAVTANGKHIGGAGFRINLAFPHKCEIGYFVDRKYWGKGIATKIVGLLEKYIAENLNIVRIEIPMAKENISSRKVAIKAGYKKEGLMRKYVKIGDRYHDSYLYAKIVK